MSLGSLHTGLVTSGSTLVVRVIRISLSFRFRSVRVHTCYPHCSATALLCYSSCCVYNKQYFTQLGFIIVCNTKRPTIHERRDGEVASDGRRFHRTLLGVLVDWC